MGDSHPAFLVRSPRHRALKRACRRLVLALLLLPLQAVAAPEDAVLMGVRQVLLDPLNRTPVVILAGGGRLLPIWIGDAEASSIARALGGQRSSRPNTHDLIGDLLEGLRATPERITITELRESTYFAVITLKAGRRRIAIDSRPSDAIAVALRTGAPIYATSQVLEQAVRLNEPAPRQGEGDLPEQQGALKRERLNDPALRRGQGVTRMMGMHMQDLTVELAKLFATELRQGVLVAHVEGASTASVHGFRRGDVIVRVDGRPIRNTRELEAAFAPRPAIRRHNFLVRRDGGSVTIVVDPPSPRKR